MLPRGNGKKERCERASPRLDLCRGDRSEHPFHFGGSVLANQPSPVWERSIVDELDDDGLLVSCRFEFLKPIRPEKTPKIIGQAGVLELGSWSGSHKSCCFIQLQYKDFAVFRKASGLASLRPTPTSAITRATAHPASSAVENAASRRINGFTR
jgi:hypothetical protein